jgi:tetratricopeptide (TPR) repeat protein
MPSLNELKEFKASFHHIGGQKANLAAKKVPFDDLELPGSEPQPLPSLAEVTATTADSADGPEPSIDPADGIDFSAFLDSDLPADDLNPPEGLLSNLSEELDAIPPDFPDEPLADDGVDKPLDLDSLDNFDMPEEPIAADSGAPAPDLGSLDNFDMPAEPVAADDGVDKPLDLDSLDNFDMPEEPIAADNGAPSPDLDGLDDFNMPEEPAAADSGDESPLNLDSFDNLDIPEEPAAADSGAPSLDLDGLDDFDMPEEPAAADSGDEPPLNLDSFDDLNIPEESAAADEDSLDLDNLGSLDVPGESAAADEGESLDSLGDLDLPEEPAAADSGDAPPLNLDSFDDLDIPEEPAAADSGAPSLDLDGLDDFNMPEEPTAADSGDAPSLNLDSLDDLNIPEEPAAADSGAPSLDPDGLDDLNMPEEPAAADSGDAPPLNLDSFDDLNIPEEPVAADSGDPSLDPDGLDDLNMPEEPAAADSGDEPPLNLDSFDDLDTPGETPEAAKGSENLDIDKLDNLGDLDVPGGTAADEGSGSPEAFDELAPTDTYDNIELDNLDDADFAEKEGAAAVATSTTQTIDDISFDELDDVLQKTHKKKDGLSSAPLPVVKSKKLGRKSKAERKKIDLAAIEDTSEIQITDDELEGLLETLSRYPLNLRIACEEIITGEIGSTKQIADLIEHLVWGASAKETAILASRILDRQIIVPKAFEKSSGAELEAEQASFAYIFAHRFLPVLRLIAFIGIVAASAWYLFDTFVYTPLKAEALYKKGYERIFAGEYQRANERFDEASLIHRKKSWYYKYAEAFRDERQYVYAEEKYEELLRYYYGPYKPGDKKGVLDYANLETNYLRNYEKADKILRERLLDWNPNDREGLLAAGDNCLVWGDVDPAKYEDARYYYARVLTQYGWQPPVVERMMKYFIRTDNLREVLPLKFWFENNPNARKYELSAETLGELGGYLLDKQLEEVKGVPNEWVEQIGSVRDLLLKAVNTDPMLPEPHYHLARYYHSLGASSAHEELVSLRVANNRFDTAPEGSIRRINYRLDAIQRYADALINDREFFPAEEQLVKGINLYEDVVSRRLIPRSPKFGRLYAVMGDLEYFTKLGDMEAALGFYHRSEQDGWAPPEMQYRMGAAYYQLENWRNALEYLFTASKSLPQNRRILFALGNAALKRGDYFAANGYYDRLLDILEGQRARLPLLLPNDRPEYLELAERLMMAQNNAGVTSEMLAAQTGNRSYHTRALAFYAESNRAWDARTRDPRSMIRSGNTPLPFLNSRNALYPRADYEPQIFIRIDREAQETSPWEALASLPRPDPDKND